MGSRNAGFRIEAAILPQLLLEKQVRFIFPEKTILSMNTYQYKDTECVLHFSCDYFSFFITGPLSSALGPATLGFLFSRGHTLCSGSGT